jgi:hypothetical protein
LLLYAAVRIGLGRGQAPLSLSSSAILSGVLVAAGGLLDWLDAGGVSADAMRRLVGPYYSPNHTALYLERTFFLAIALMIGLQDRNRRRAGLAAALIAIALFLTGSRGAILLAIPTGLLVITQITPSPRRLTLIIRSWTVIGPMLVLSLLALVYLWPRISNVATVQERVAGWAASSELWIAHMLTGVGPGGFFWRFPAFLSPYVYVDPNLSHPHNLWLEFATTWGLAGLLWWLFAAYLVIHRYRALQRQTQLPARSYWIQMGAIAGLAAGFAHGQVDAFMVLPDLALWNWLALALLAHQSLPQNQSGCNPKATT